MYLRLLLIYSKTTKMKYEKEMILLRYIYMAYGECGMGIGYLVCCVDDVKQAVINTSTPDRG